MPGPDLPKIEPGKPLLPSPMRNAEDYSVWAAISDGLKGLMRRLRKRDDNRVAG